MNRWISHRYSRGRLEAASRCPLSALASDDPLLGALKGGGWPPAAAAIATDAATPNAVHSAVPRPRRTDCPPHHEHRTCCPLLPKGDAFQ